MADSPQYLGPSASIQVLTNADLLYIIFTFVPLSSNNRDNDLAQCVHVSHTFHESAIRVLWRNLDSLLPLWHLFAPPNTPFPTGSYKHTAFSNNDGVCDYLKAVRVPVHHILISLTRFQINLAELYRDPVRCRRFLHHAAYVRSITYGMNTHPIDAENSVLTQAVLAENGGNTMFPLLRTIVLFQPLDDTLASFLSSTLRRATFTLKGSSKAQNAFSLRKICDASPFLEKIDLFSGFGHEGALSLSGVIQQLADFSHLQEVRISRCSGSDAFQLLTTHPNLRYLKIRRITGPWVGYEDTISVPGLHQLSLNGDASTLPRLFSLVSFRALKTASISLNSSVETQLTSTDITNFLALFYKAVSTSGLQNLEFTPDFQGIPGFVDDGHHALTLRDLIAPILPIRDLRSFTFNRIPQCTIVSLDDTDIVALASAWPLLEDLSVGRGFTTRSRVSIAAMHYLYGHCPSLQGLSIPHIRWPVIGVDAIPAPLERSPPHPLRHLSLPMQFIVTANLQLYGPDLSDDGVEGMARYLFDLFPRLDLDQCKHEWVNSRSSRKYLPETIRFDDRWRRVIGHIYSICRARDGL